MKSIENGVNVYNLVRCRSLLINMTSLAELCDLIPLPPELVECVCTNLCYCEDCDKWKKNVTCTKCQQQAHSMDSCDWGCCRYCHTCAKLKWCPRQEYMSCIRHMEESDWGQNHPCPYNNDNCTLCHREKCYECCKYFCCNHHIEMPAYDEPIFFCLKCWPKFRAGMDAEVECLIEQDGRRRVL